MKIAAAQLRPVSGDVAANLLRHHDLLRLAQQTGVELLCFPELSLTGYEPRLAGQVAMHAEDPRIAFLQQRADDSGITLAAGLPVAAQAGTRIGMLIIRPGRVPLPYAKRLLHADELPWFVPGEGQVAFDAGEHRISPAICYESLQDSHAQDAAALGANLYMASVAKSARGVERGFEHYPAIARRHGMVVLMANAIGPCDDFIAAGSSAIWSAGGECVVSLEASREGIAVFDTATGQAGVRYL